MSQLEDTLVWQVQAAKLPAPVRELRFAPPRRWRFDLAWPEQRLAVECQGAVWTQGRHTRGSGAEADAEKLSAAVLAGWRVLVVTGRHIKSGQALNWIEAGLATSARS